jgi:hypothetical protein
VRVFPDEVTNTGEESDHETDGAYTSENDCIDEHDLPPALWRCCFDGFKLPARQGSKFDLDQ